MGKKLHGVDGHPGLLKDPVSKSIINSDREQLNIARKQKREALNRIKRETEIDQRLTRVETTMERILTLLEKTHG